MKETITFFSNNGEKNSKKLKKLKGNGHIEIMKAKIIDNGIPDKLVWAQIVGLIKKFSRMKILFMGFSKNSIAFFSEKPMNEYLIRKI